MTRPETRRGPYTGTSVRRLEDPRLVTGRGRYVDDLQLAGMAHAAVLRSIEAHARLDRIDTSRALAAPGVLAVVTAADLGPVQRPLPLFVPHTDLRPAMPTPLAPGVARYAGEPIAVLVATSRYAAEDALELIDVGYAPLPPVVDADAALEPGSTIVHPELGSNLAATLEFRIGDADAAFAGADAVFRERLSIGRISGQSMETRGVVASWEPATGQLAIWDSTQTPHLTQRAVSELLGLPADRVRVIAPDVGGGFGPKGVVYPEEVLVPWLAMRLGRPVKWIEERREHFLSAYQEREQRHDAEIAMTRDGRILGIRDSYIADQGAYCPWGVVVPMLTSIAMPGPYRIPTLHNRAQVVYTNKTPVAPYRGAGRPQAVFVMERLLEVAARGLALDPLEVRARNLIPADAFPYDVGMLGRDGTSVVYDSGDYPACLARVRALIEADAFRVRQAEALAEGRYLGLGVASYVEATGLGPYEGAIVRVDAGGGVTVATGSANHGQGHETIFAQLVADRLGVEISRVRVTTGDTGTVPIGIGTFASRSSVVAGNAASQAATGVAEQLRSVAADLLEASPGDIELRDGRASIIGSPDRSVSLEQIVGAVYGTVPGATMRRAVALPIEASCYFQPEGPTYANGTHAAIVEVDPVIGRVQILRYVIVHDCGEVLNPRLLEGQIVGGLAQGLGNALLEEIVYDEIGQPKVTSFMDYLMPTAASMPDELVIEHLVSPSPRNPLGVKGAGEAGTIPAPAVIANAVEDALRPLGVGIRRVPILPWELQALIQSGAASAASSPRDRTSRSAPDLDPERLVDPAVGGVDVAGGAG